MYNAAETIESALRSLRWQTFSNWELILIDDGSTDDSVQRSQALADARVRLMVDGQRRGLAARLNQAIDLACGRYLARVDADDIAYPERLERQIAYLEAHQEVDLLGARMLVFGGEGVPVGLFPVATTHDAICARPYSGFYLPHPTWMGRTEWFRRWRYDPSCGKAQDQELLLRSHAFSRFAALPEALVGYRQERVSVHKSLLGRGHFSRGIWRAAMRERRVAQGLGALALQTAKLVFDAMAVATGLERALLRHRAHPLSAEGPVSSRPARADRAPQNGLQPSPRPLAARAAARLRRGATARAASGARGLFGPRAHTP